MFVLYKSITEIKNFILSYCNNPPSIVYIHVYLYRKGTEMPSNDIYF